MVQGSMLGALTCQHALTAAAVDLLGWPCPAVLQVELLLTFEEYCSEEEAFEGEHGAWFADIFDLVGHLCLAAVACFLQRASVAVQHRAQCTGS